MDELMSSVGHLALKKGENSRGRGKERKQATASDPCRLSFVPVIILGGAEAKTAAAPAVGRRHRWERKWNETQRRRRRGIKPTPAARAIRLGVW
jgi:hypothetical protein